MGESRFLFFQTEDRAKQTKGPGVYCHFILQIQQNRRKSGTLKGEKRYFTHRKAVLFLTKSGAFPLRKQQPTDYQTIKTTSKFITKKAYIPS